MWTLAVLLCSAVTSASSSPLRKCCDFDSLLSVEAVNNGSTFAVCVPLTNVSGQGRPSLHVHGPVDIGLPEPCAPQHRTTVKPWELPPGGCVDQMFLGVHTETTLTGIKCESHLTRSLAPQLATTVRKCCPRGSKYDYTLRVCRQSNTTAEDELQLTAAVTGNATGFVSVTYGGFPSCRLMVLVDFLLEEEDIADWNSSVCVDTLVGDRGVGGRKCIADRSTCERIPCVTKCCATGQRILNGKCRPTTLPFEPVFYNVSNVHHVHKVNTPPREFAIIQGLKCKEGQFILNKSKGGDEHYLATNGKLFVPSYKALTPNSEYCIDDFDYVAKNLFGFQAFLCFPEKDEFDVRYLLLAVGMVISCTFLLITLLVYVCLPPLHGNLHGKILMFLITSYSAALICLSLMQLSIIGDKLRYLCKPLGYIMAFSWLSTFAWLNVMCFDIWMTFGMTRSVNRGTRKSRDRRKLCIYGLYTWGIPAVITAALMCADLVDMPESVSKVIKPSFGDVSCWFTKENYGEMIFFIIPNGLFICCNVVLFVMTARYCSKVKAEINRMQNAVDDHCKKRIKSDKKKLIMNGKLFVIMGVSWSFEFISYFFPEVPEMWYLSDIFNACQGFFIFSVYVLKRNVLRSFGDRCNSCCRSGDERKPSQPSRLDTHNRKISASSTCFTTTTTLNGRISPAKN